MSNAEFNPPPNKSIRPIINNSEITRNEKIILGVLLFIMSVLLVVIGQKIIQRRFPVGHNSVMVGADRYQGIFGTTSIQYIFNLAQSKKTNIKLFSILPQSAELSPDGQWIVFSTRGEIYIMRVDGTQQTRVSLPHRGYEPTWSPDGKQIAFLGYGSQPGIHIANIECLLRGESCSPTFRLLVREPMGYQLGSPDWSPDGRKIAYTTITSTRYISVIDAAGQGKPVRLPLHISGTSQEPQWSPDGTKIVGICRGTVSGICVMNSDGSDLVLLKGDTKREYAEQPSWSPDGKMIAYISISLKHKISQFCWPDGCSSVLRPSSVMIMTADGKAITQLPFGNSVITRWFFWYP